MAVVDANKGEEELIVKSTKIQNQDDAAPNVARAQSTPPTVTQTHKRVPLMRLPLWRLAQGLKEDREYLAEYLASTARKGETGDQNPGPTPPSMVPRPPSSAREHTQKPPSGPKHGVNPVRQRALSARPKTSSGKATGVRIPQTARPPSQARVFSIRTPSPALGGNRRVMTARPATGIGSRKPPSSDLQAVLENIRKRINTPQPHGYGGGVQAADYNSLKRELNKLDKAGDKQVNKKLVERAWEGENGEKGKSGANVQRPATSAGERNSSGKPELHLTDFYGIGKEIGEGSFGKVYLGIQKLTGEKAAIKTYERYKLYTEFRRRRVEAEIDILGRINHPNIVKLYEVMQSPRRIHVVMEYVDGGDLRHYLKSKKRLDENEARRIMKQIVEGMVHLHSKDIVHRDVKLENMLLDHNKNIKIADFGLSIIVPEGKRLSKFCGTPSYIPPEVLCQKKYLGPQADVWSLGILMYVMLVGAFPFHGRNCQELKEHICRGYFKLPESMSQDAKNMIRSMLQQDANLRPSMRQLQDHYWMKKETIGPPPPVAIEEINAENLDEAILREMQALGMHRHEIVDAIARRKFNHTTATYRLLALRKRRCSEHQAALSAPALLT